MKWYKSEEVFNSHHAIRNDNKGKSLPATLSDALIESLGYTKVVETPRPDVTAVQIASQNGVEVLSDGTVQTVWKVQDMFSDILDADGVTVIKTKADQEAEYLAPKVPEVVTMRQARLALLQANLLTAVQDAIANGSDEAMKIEWEYATEVRRDWASLISLAAALNMSDAELDGLFILAGTL